MENIIIINFTTATDVADLIPTNIITTAIHMATATAYKTTTATTATAMVITTATTVIIINTKCKTEEMTILLFTFNLPFFVRL